MIRVCFLLTFLISTTGSAQSDSGNSFTEKSKQCFELFSLHHAAHFARLKGYGVKFRKPEYQTFLYVNSWMFRLEDRLPRDMHPKLKWLASEVISGYENAVPMTVKIYQEYYDPKNVQASGQFIADYYLALISARLVGSNLDAFEKIVRGDLARGVDYLNDRGAIFSRLTARRTH